MTTNTTPQKGQLLETVAGICDGRTVTVESGTYTFPNITSGTNLTSATWQDVPGSNIDYKPPSGTKQIIYNFIVTTGRIDAGDLVTFRFVVDGQVVYSEFVKGTASHYGDRHHLKLIINIGDTTDYGSATFSNWDTNKTI